MIPQTDPKASYLAQKAEIDAAVLEVLARGAYILGPQVAAFEREFAAFTGAAFGLGVASGTDAITLGLRALGIGRGDGVATVSHTATATAAAIELSGATPVLLDVEPEGFGMDPAALERLLADPPLPIRAVVPVHLYGGPCRIAEICGIAGRHGAVVLEDASQAHGAMAGGRRVGSFGAAGAFSLYPTKNLGAFGDGGVLVTSGEALDGRARRLREYGWRRRFVAEEPGMNSRLDELQAAILRVKLRRLDEANARRAAIAARYAEGLANLPLRAPAAREGDVHVWHQYVIRVRGRDEVRARLAEAGVGTAIHYPEPVHRQDAYARLPVGPGGLEATEALAGEILSLPMYPELADEDVERVIEAVRAAVRGGAG